MRFFLSVALTCLAAGVAFSAETTMAARLAPHTEEIATLAADPELVQAVVAQNAQRRERFKSMTADDWKLLPKNDRYVISFKTNTVSELLRKHRGAIISEAFVNDAEGFKVGFLEKPSDWNHRGKPKHDQAMAGKIWTSPVELDESSGAKQVQIAVPVWSEGKAVGSLVVGLNIFQLSASEKGPNERPLKFTRRSSGDGFPSVRNPTETVILHALSRD